jgi:hypothetical protein
VCGAARFDAARERTREDRVAASRITGIDSDKILDQAFEAAKTFRPMSADQVAALVARTRPYATEGKYEFFKTSSHFDSTARHPDWLGEDSPVVQRLAPPVG